MISPAMSGSIAEKRAALNMAKYKDAAIYVALILLSILFLLPFFWTVSSSLKDPSEIHRFPPIWFPAVPQWQNYAEVLSRVPFMLWVGNSAIITIVSIAGSVFSASFVAFAFARLEFTGRDLFFMVTLGTMMLPVEVTIIPTYMLFNKLGWLDTLLPLIVPPWFGGGAFGIFLVRQFFLTIPRDLDEAAYMDGANPIHVYARILVPLSKPVLATLAVIGFIGHWNDFLRPLIFLNSPENFPLSLGLQYFKEQPGFMAMGEIMDHLLMAASVMTLLPTVILFFSAQRYFVQGVVMSGIKG